VGRGLPVFSDLDIIQHIHEDSLKKYGDSIDCDSSLMTIAGQNFGHPKVVAEAPPTLDGER